MQRFLVVKQMARTAITVLEETTLCYVDARSIGISAGNNWDLRTGLISMKLGT
jgi:hypothetical protein